MNNELTHDEQAALDAALGYFKANAAAIFTASRCGDVLARELARSFIQFTREQNVVIASELVNNVAAWQERVRV